MAFHCSFHFNFFGTPPLQLASCHHHHNSFQFSHFFASKVDVSPMYTVAGPAQSHTALTLILMLILILLLMLMLMLMWLPFHYISPLQGIQGQQQSHSDFDAAADTDADVVAWSILSSLQGIQGQYQSHSGPGPAPGWGSPSWGTGAPPAAPPPIRFFQKLKKTTQNTKNTISNTKYTNNR